MRHIMILLVLVGVVGCGGDDGATYNYYTPDREWTEPAQITGNAPTVYYDTRIPADERRPLHRVDKNWREVKDCVGVTAEAPDVFWVKGILKTPELTTFGLAQKHRNRVYVSDKITGLTSAMGSVYWALRHEFVHIVLYQNGDPDSGRDHTHWAFDACV